MKLLLQYVLVLSLFPMALWAQNRDEIRISASFKNRPFPDVVEQLEKEYDLQFYFKEQWVEGLFVNLEIRELSIPEMMDKLLQGREQGYAFEPPNTIFLLPGKAMIWPLPEYDLEWQSVDSEGVVDQERTSMGEKYLLGRQADMIETIVVGSRDKAVNGRSVVINGRLTDAESGEPLIGATMHVPALQKGVATGTDGALIIRLKPGLYQTAFQCMGMKEVKANLDVRSGGFFSLTMKQQVQAIQEVVVEGDEVTKRGAKVGMESVSVKTMKELPTLMGEKDVLKVAQLLPGVVSVGEGSAGVNVRGGNADQNLFYINNIPIYNSSHLFGFFSAINSGIIENFSIYKGQVPSEYGGRLASIFQVETRKGNKKKFFTQGGVSPISANAEIEMPLVEDKVSLMLSARSSYSDWILKRLDDPDLRNSKASFYDFAGAVDFVLNEKNQLSLFAYNSNDDFNLNGYTEYGYGNQGASVNYLHRFSPALKSNVFLVASNYNFSTADTRLSSESYQHDYELDHYEMKVKFGWIPNEVHTLNAGASAILYQLNRGAVEPFGDESLKSPVMLGKENGLETAFFIDDNIALGARLNLYAGFRFNMFTAFGPKTVREYLPGTALNDINVSGSKTYGSGEQMVTYQNPELRAGLDFQIRQNNSIKLSVTQMTQYLFMLSNTISIAPNDQWKMVDNHIKPPKSIQYSAGYYHAIPKLGLSATAEFYYKMGKNLVEYKDGADFLASSYVETTILQGKQETYGAEFMLSRDVGRFNGWASYTYSRSLITVNGENDFEDINQGKTYPSNFDKPHVFNLVTNYKPFRRLSFSFNMVYNTGRPITMPEGVYYVDDQPFVDYSDRNAYRIPDYWRMDASIKLEGNLKSKKPMHSYWMLSVYNLTGRSNVNSIFFQSEDGHLKGYQYAVIGVPIVTLSWNWKLGNYANN
ncbi:TonB-dependent receptor [Sunxiuqinia sp. sy24]|uniref:TonB-dependent receptor n=1 Tax=Sunxiuqinia sp. sy24 TaxID=3461495 RepID=UPI004045419E